MNTVYKAALRAPDHAWLRTSSFIEVKGKGLDKLSDIFVNYGKSITDISDEVLDKYKNVYRVLMIIILINSYIEHPKVPAINKIINFNSCTKHYASFKCHEIFCIWRTEKDAFNKIIQKNLA